MKMDHNLYWDASRHPVSFAGMDFAGWQKSGKNAGSLVADPLFVAPEQFDFHLRPGSPAEALGFKPFDYSQAGVYGDADWRELAGSVSYPPVGTPPAPPPLTLKEDFENQEPGAAPRFAKVSVEGKGDSIAVTDEAAATGGHSLRVVDVPGMKADYDPHFYYVPEYRENVARCDFDFRAGPGAILCHEWRDWHDMAKPYKVGPTITIRDGKLFACGRTQPVMDIPADTWVHFQISAALGARAGTWDMTVAVRGQTPRHFAGLPNGSATWKVLDWFGFSSGKVQGRTTYYLDNLELKNTGE
jgi:hypothetical protein